MPSTRRVVGSQGKAQRQHECNGARASNVESVAWIGVVLTKGTSKMYTVGTSGNVLCVRHLRGIGVIGTMSQRRTLRGFRMFRLDGITY